VRNVFRSDYPPGRSVIYVAVLGTS
jgi:hypothetical protein